MLPVKNGRVSQEYGRPGRYRKGYHSGLDLVADGQDKGIYAIGSGAVLRARFAAGKKGADPAGWGNYVIVRQDDGYDVLYAHLSSVCVKQEQAIASGNKIGVQGSTGNTTGPHLHFEVWNGVWTAREDINAADYLGVANKVGIVQIGTYPDVPANNWAAESVARVTEAGVMSVHPDGKFYGKSFVTRYELASALDRILNLIKEKQ